MTKATKENIKDNIQCIKEVLDMSDADIQKIFGKTKSECVKNVLNVILRELDK